MINVFFTKENLNTIDTGHEKRISIILKTVFFCWNLTWWNLKELAELDNLTVSILMQFSI